MTTTIKICAPHHVHSQYTCTALDWMSAPTPNSYVKILTPKRIALGSGAFRRWVWHKGIELMNGINALIKEIPESSLDPSVLWGQSEKTAVCEPGREPWPDTNCASALISSFLAWKKKKACCLSHPVLYFCYSSLTGLRHASICVHMHIDSHTESEDILFKNLSSRRMVLWYWQEDWREKKPYLVEDNEE